MYFKKLKHPEYFQGNHKKKNYFEGWYYKLVNQKGDHTLALIPGISLNLKDPHAFIQVFISKTIEQKTKLSSYYLRFKKEDFSYGHDHFYVKIGPNYFSKDKVSLDLKHEKFSLFGILSLDHLTPIHNTLLSPNIMGIFGYLGFMECYHGIVSMDHHLDGSFKLNGEIISFDHGKGYIEKDWGRSFPRAYVWLQSNHFKDPNTSLMFSYADIPFLGFYFKGLIANLIYQGKEYRFATYNGGKVIKEEVKDKKVIYMLKRRSYTLYIEASSTTEIALASPRNGMMIEQIKEGLSGKISIQLYDKDQLIYEDIGLHAGIEIMK